jgi:hypothetical protein
MAINVLPKFVTSLHHSNASLLNLNFINLVFLIFSKKFLKNKRVWWQMHAMPALGAGDSRLAWAT